MCSACVCDAIVYQLLKPGTPCTYLGFETNWEFEDHIARHDLSDIPADKLKR